MLSFMAASRDAALDILEDAMRRVVSDVNRTTALGATGVAGLADPYPGWWIELAVGGEVQAGWRSIGGQRNPT